MASKALLEALRRTAVKKGDFTLASGKRSDYYINMKEAYTDPEVLRIITREIAGLLRDVEMDRIAGVAVGGVPLATALSLELGVPFLIVRKERKGYGTDVEVEGSLREGEEVVLVEDVTTTGGSVLAAAEALERKGGRCRRVVVVVDRLEGAREALGARGIELIPLTTGEELMRA